MGKNIDKLGDTLIKQMRKTSNGAVRTVAELGTIGAGLALQPDTSPGPIPKGEYMTAIHLTMGEAGAEFAETTTDGTPAHSHKAKLPEELRSIKQGDRVLIIWCGTEPVIISIVK